jgi:hypothetical protein
MAVMAVLLRRIVTSSIDRKSNFFPRGSLSNSGTKKQQKTANNADVGDFLDQFVEDSPGIWRCIGEYTQADGTYEKMKKRFAKK